MANVVIRIDAYGNPSHGCRWEVLDEESEDASHKKVLRIDTVSWISRTGDLAIDFAFGPLLLNHPGPFIALRGQPTKPESIRPQAPLGSYGYFVTVSGSNCITKLELCLIG